MMKNKEIELKDKELNQKSQELNPKSNMIINMINLFKRQGMADEEIAKELNISIEELIEMKKK